MRVNVTGFGINGNFKFDTKQKFPKKKYWDVTYCDVTYLTFQKLIYFQDMFGPNHAPVLYGEHGSITTSVS